MTVKDHAKIYIEAFNQHDLNILANMFHPDISLRDWETSVDGKEALLAHMEELFEAVPTIYARIQDVIVDGNKAVLQLEITVTEDTPLLVVDVLVFDNANRILSINAYKG